MSEETSIPATPAHAEVVPQMISKPSSASWFQRLSALLFVVFCFELGLFLLIYPWISAWSDNYFAWAVPQALQKSWNIFWNNAYFRGAVSGLGILNVWIALVEIFRLLTRR